MKAKDLGVIWDRPDSTRLAPKQISIRLPVHVLARIRALEEMYPTRTRTELIGDLLSSALDEVENGLRVEKGECLGPCDPGDAELCYEVAGPADRFRTLSNKHYAEIEGELGNKSPSALFGSVYVISESEFEAQKK